MRQTSDAKTMTTRDFLHGGYREPGEPVVVLAGGEVAGVWFPGNLAITVTPPTLYARAEPVGSAGLGHTTVKESPRPRLPELSAQPVRAVPKPTSNGKGKRR